MGTLAIELVHKCYETQDPYLDLGMCGLRDMDFVEGSELDVALRTCVHLETLILSNAWEEWNEKEKRFINRKSSNGIESNFINALPLFLVTIQNLTELVYGGDDHRNSWGIYNIGLLKSARKLQILSLGYNRIKDLDLVHIAFLKNLTTLDIHCNEISEIGMALISELTNLKILNLSFNNVSKVTPHIAKLKNLIHLDLTSANVTGESIEHIARLNNLTSLHLSFNKISDKGAEYFTELVSLTKLYISDNQIKDKGVRYIAELKNLILLDLRNNKISSKGAAYISSLKNLTSLYLGENKVRDDGAKHIAELKNLTTLNISHARISDKGMKYIAELKNLMFFNISGNQISDDSAEYIAELKNLEILEIDFNPIFQIDTIKMFITKLINLYSIFFDVKYMHGLPKEIGTNIKALRAWFSSTEKIPNTLIKMILIGNTTAGKSSLADFLVNKEYKADRDSTHGIQLWRWKTPDKKSHTENNLQVNIWDFGGQDYYHAIHNLFLDDKTLFLLLQTSKEMHIQKANEMQYLPANYWLGNIRNITSSASQIWYIHSKAEKSRFLYLNSDWLHRYNVDRQFNLSVKLAAEGDNSAVGDFNNFKNHLLQALNTLAKDELPASWAEIRDNYLPKWREGKIFITQEEFKQACEDALKTDQRLLTDLNNSWDGLLPYLKGSGEIVYFKESASLNNLIFLSAESLTKGIYHVLSKEVKNNTGIFTLKDLQKTDPAYALTYLDVLLAFKLIFEKSDKKGEYVSPQYLSENEHSLNFQKALQITYVIRFPDYMSRSIITQFLVEYAGKHVDNRYWRYGAFLNQWRLSVFVKIDAEQQKIYVHMAEGNNQDKFAILKELFIFFTLPKEKENTSQTSFQSPLNDKAYSLKLKEVAKFSGDTELSLNGTDFASITNLLDAAVNNLYKVKSNQAGYIEFNTVLHQLLDTNRIMRKKIFFSYSHKDERYKTELDAHFAALKEAAKLKPGKIEKYWLARIGTKVLKTRY